MRVGVFLVMLLHLGCGLVVTEVPADVVQRFNECLMTGDPTPEEDQKASGHSGIGSPLPPENVSCWFPFRQPWKGRPPKDRAPLCEFQARTTPGPVETLAWSPSIVSGALTCPSLFGLQVVLCSFVSVYSPLTTYLIGPCLNLPQL